MAPKPIQILINAKDEASAVFGRVSKSAVALGAVLASYVGINSFVNMVRGAADFEQAMSRVKAATGASGAELQALQKAAEDAGAKTQYTSSQAAGALETLAKAGLTSEQAIKALNPVLDMAAAADVDLATAAEYTTKAIMGMGLSFDDAGRVADVLAKGANASNTSVSGLASALSYVAPVANASKLSLESVVGILGKLADGGIAASRAGTALNSILSQFSDPASKFRQALLSAGITTKDFEQALRQLADAGPGAETAILAVGTEAGPALRSLLNQGMGALDGLTQKLRDSQGAAAEAARVIGDNLSGSIKGLGSAWDSVTGALTTPVLPVLKDGVDKLAQALRGAVSDGTIAQFGAALKTAFEGAVQWAQKFVASFNWDELKARLTAFGTEFGQTMAKIAEYASTTSNTVQVAWGAISTGANTVMGVIYKIAEAFSGVASNIQSGVALIMDGFAKITFGGISAGFKAAADEIRLSAEATWAVSEAFAAKANASFQAATASAESLRNSWSALTGGVTELGTQASQSAVGVAQLKDATAELHAELQKQADANAAARKAQEEKAAADVQAKQRSEELRATIERLRLEYQELLQAGDVQGAVGKLKEIERATQELGKAQQGVAKDTDGAKKATQEFSATLTRMGVDADVAMGGISGATRAAIEDIDSLSANAKAAGLSAEQTGRAMEMAFASAIPKAGTLESVAALEAKLKELAGSGQIGAAGMERLQQALQEQKGVVESAMPGIQSLNEALKTLGVTPQAELDALAKKSREAFDAVKNSGTASAREINESWKAMAEASIKANDGVADATIKSEAAARGFAIETNAAGKSVVKSLGEAKGAAKGVGDALGAAGEEGRDALGKIDYGAKVAGKSMEELNKITEKNWDANRDLADQAAEHNAAANESVNAWQKQQQEQNKYYGEMVKILQKTRMGFAELNKAAWAGANALEALDKQQKAIEQSSGGAAKELQDMRDKLAELDGDEETTARRRADRDKAEVQRKQALMQLDLQRAQIRKDDDEVARLSAELAAYQEQLRLIDQIAAKESQARQRKAREEKAAQRERDRAQEESARRDRDAHSDRMDGIAEEGAARDAEAERLAQEAQKKLEEEMRKRQAAEDEALRKKRAAEDKAASERAAKERKALEDAEKQRQEALRREAEARAEARRQEDERIRQAEAARVAREKADRDAAAKAAEAQEAQRADREAKAKKGTRSTEEEAALARQRDAVLAAQKQQAEEQARLEAERAEAAAQARAKRLQEERSAEDQAAAERESIASEAHQKRLQELDEAERKRQERVQEERAREDERIAAQRERDAAMLKAMQDVAASVLAIAQASGAKVPLGGAQAGQASAPGLGGAVLGRDAASAGNGGGGGAGVSRTVSVNLAFEGRSLGAVDTSPGGADVLQRLFSQLERGRRSAA